MKENKIKSIVRKYLKKINQTVVFWFIVVILITILAYYVLSHNPQPIQIENAYPSIYKSASLPIKFVFFNIVNNSFNEHPVTTIIDIYKHNKTWRERLKIQNQFYELTKLGYKTGDEIEINITFFYCNHIQIQRVYEVKLPDAEWYFIPNVGYRSETYWLVFVDLDLSDRDDTSILMYGKFIPLRRIGSR